MPRVMLEGPGLCTIFCFNCAHTLCLNYVTNTFLLVSSSVRSKQLLCILHCQGQKSEQKPTTKNFVGFHNHSPVLTMAHIKPTLQISVKQPFFAAKHYVEKWMFSVTVGSHIKVEIMEKIMSAIRSLVLL